MFKIKKSFISFCLLAATFFSMQVLAQPSNNYQSNKAMEEKAKVDYFPKQLQLDGAKLSLNGRGIRYKAIFKVYDMGLYTSSKATTMQDVINAKGPKKLQFIALRDISTSDLGQLFYRGIKENSTQAQNLRHMTSALRISEVASGRLKIKEGEHFSLEYIPSKGLIFSVMDEPQGTPIGDAEFFEMVLGIWLGSVPADYKLKDALLGLPKT